MMLKWIHNKNVDNLFHDFLAKTVGGVSNHGAQLGQAFDLS